MYESVDQDPNEKESVPSTADGDGASPLPQKNPNEFAESNEDKSTDLPLASKSNVKPRKAPELPVVERRNWLIHHHFLRQEWDACKAMTKEQLDETSGSCEYASYVKGLILRQEGKIQESLDMFQACAMMNPTNAGYLKQIARTLLLLGKFKTSIDVFGEAVKITSDDWEIFHWKAVCFRQLQENQTAKECLRQAVTLSKHEESFVLLAEIFASENDIMNAIDCYKRALELSPENPDYLTSLGLLYLKTESQQQAFEALGRALGFDPTHSGAILAAGSMMQQHADYDVALTKYRVAAQQWPDSPHLWSNIGMCFYGKKKFVAAISCLKRANYLAPLDWKILYNLGLVHLEMQQHASAFHFLSAAININPKVAILYMTLAVVLTNLDDLNNAKQAYEHALKLDQKDPTIAFNYAVFLFKQNEMDKAKVMLETYQFRIQNFKESRPGVQKIPREILQMAEYLSQSLRTGQKSAPEEPNVKNDPETSNYLSESPERNKKESFSEENEAV